MFRCDNDRQLLGISKFQEGNKLINFSYKINMKHFTFIGISDARKEQTCRKDKICNL